MGSLVVELLGGLRVFRDGKPLPPFESRKVEALLGYLVLHRGRPLPREALAGLLWPEKEEAQARMNLRHALYVLRRALGSEHFQTSRNWIRFIPAAGLRLDVEEFEGLLGREAESEEERRRCLEQAVELYRGPFLEGVYEDWVLAERDRIRGRYVDALLELAGQSARRGEYRRAVGLCRQALQAAPYSEAAYRHLMQYHYQAGAVEEALRAYQECAQALEGELGLRPSPATRALRERILAGTPLPGQAPGGDRFPQPMTPFVGREEELATLARLLSDPQVQLITLAGPGGVGKTRLALEVARRAAHLFSHGVHFLPLESVSQAAHLVPALATSLGLPPCGPKEMKGRLFSFLGDRNLLLLLDGFEHLLEEAGLLLELGEAAPALKLLVTSREPLKLPGEKLIALSGLDASGEVEESPAGRLFLQCARRAHPGFRLSPEDKPKLARLLALVEGLPLAIELAAPWLKVLSLDELAREIERGLGVLSQSPRGLRAAFDHSWNLLSQEERRAFRRLGVFQGGFRREAAEAVTDTSPSVLLSLTYKSLLRRTPAGRYLMHGLLLAYAQEQLAASGEEGEIRDRHAQYFLELVRVQGGKLKGRGQREALQELGEELGNVRAAWGWAAARRRWGLLDRALDGLYLLYETLGWIGEGREALAQLEASLQGEQGLGALQGRVFARQGRFYFRLGELEQAERRLRAALRLARRFSTPGEEALALNLLGLLARRRGRLAEAEELLKAALAIRRALSLPWETAASLNNLGLLALDQGQYRKAREYFQESLALCRAGGDREGETKALGNLGNVAFAQGDWAEAETRYREALKLFRELGDRRGEAIMLNNLGYLARLAGDFVEARRLFQDSERLFAELGDRWGVAAALTNSGWTEHLLGNEEAGERLLREGLALRRKLGDRRGTVYSLVRLGLVLLSRGKGGAAELREALELALEAGAVSLILDALSACAVYLSQKGKEKEAQRLAACVLSHPNAAWESKGWARAASGLDGSLAPLEATDPVGLAREALRWLRAG